MMSVGMHCRLLGRPGRMRALQRFLDHVAGHERVWVTRRIDIARHWKAVHPFDAAHRVRRGTDADPSLDAQRRHAAQFAALLDGIYEHRRGSPSARGSGARSPAWRS